MPQLDTSAWPITVISMILTLFIVFQLKVLKFGYPSNPEPKMHSKNKHANPWEMKWTKIYLPLSLPQ
uniref:ATP synthase complex subunit 8 n=1 Tax=Avahi laniger TaxID=122246 RepID=S4UTS4_AVALA|nr:ATP synthase subunit 8 [Avahi laniger]AGM47376.1 ATP synthase subunit 8 [Avahi laniger]